MLSCVWLEGDKQPTDSGNYIGKFSLLNRSDSGDEDEDDVGADSSGDGFIDVVKVSLIVLLA